MKISRWMVVQPLLCTALLLAVATVPFHSMDLARKETRVDEAVAKFGVTGRGVLVAIMDRGIDWQSNDFRNADGSTRIEYIFDLGDDSGANAAGNPYKLGTIYTRTQIDSALRGGPRLPHRDAIGHGTTTAGIACGNGRNSPGQKYRGMAPNATLIVVKPGSGAAACGDQPAEPNVYDPEFINLVILG